MAVRCAANLLWCCWRCAFACFAATWAVETTVNHAHKKRIRTARIGAQHATDSCVLLAPVVAACPFLTKHFIMIMFISTLVQIRHELNCDTPRTMPARSAAVSVCSAY